MNEEEFEEKTVKDLLRRCIPRFLLQQRGIVRRLGPAAGRIYTKIRVQDALGLSGENPQSVPPDTRSFAFVCFGNIMRSAMAECLMRKALSEIPAEEMSGIRIVSAGLHADPGREAHPRMIEAATELGIPMAAHRARRLTREMVDSAEAIFAMDFQNKAELLTLYPDAANKIYMMCIYGDESWKSREISDPFLGDPEAARDCAKQLQTCIRNLLNATVFARATEKPAAYEEPLART